MKPMTYKGYAARIEYSDEDGCLVGRVVGINNVIGFHGESVGEMRRAFEEAVDDYLATCEKAGRPAQTPASGKFVVRMEPELHFAVAAIAEASGQSMNTWLVDRVRDALKAGAPAMDSALARLGIRRMQFSPAGRQEDEVPSQAPQGLIAAARGKAAAARPAAARKAASRRRSSTKK